MAFQTVSATGGGGATPNVEIPSIDAGAADAGKPDISDLASDKSTDQLLEELGNEIDKEGIDFSPADDDTTTTEKPADKTKIPPADDADDNDSTPLADDADDAANQDDGEVAQEGEVDTELRALESLHRLPAKSLEGFSSVKDAELHLARFYDQLVQQQQQFDPGQQMQPPPGQQQQPPLADKAKVPPKIDLEQWEADDPTRVAIEALLKQNEELTGKFDNVDRFLQQQQVVEQARLTETVVTKFHGEVDKLESDVFGDRTKGLSKQQELSRRTLGNRVAAIGSAYARQGEAIEYADLIEMAKASPEFKSALAKEQLSQNGNGSRKSPGQGKKLGSPGRGTSPKDSVGAAAINYDGPVEDNPALLAYANERLADG